MLEVLKTRSTLHPYGRSDLCTNDASDKIAELNMSEALFGMTKDGIKISIPHECLKVSSSSGKSFVK